MSHMHLFTLISLLTLYRRVGWLLLVYSSEMQHMGWSFCFTVSQWIHSECRSDSTSNQLSDKPEPRSAPRLSVHHPWRLRRSLPRHAAPETPATTHSLCQTDRHHGKPLTLSAVSGHHTEKTVGVWLILEGIYKHYETQW